MSIRTSRATSIPNLVNLPLASSAPQKNPGDQPPDSRNVSKLEHIHRTQLTSFGEVVFDPGGRYGPRYQDRYELLFLWSGSLSLVIDGAEVLVKQGEVTLLKPGHEEWLKFSEHRRSSQAWAILRKELIPSTLLSRLARAPSVIRVPDEMRALLDVALSLPDQITPMTALMLDHIGLALLVAYIRQAEAETDAGGALPGSILKSFEYMEHHLAEPMTLAEISRAACVTPHHLIKLFRKHLNTTPVKFLWQLRLQRGSELLRTTVLDIGEIAYRIGYQSPFHFSRSFKAAHGSSPKAFRSLIWKANPVDKK